MFEQVTYHTFVESKQPVKVPSGAGYAMVADDFIDNDGFDDLALVTNDSATPATVSATGTSMLYLYSGGLTDWQLTPAGSGPLPSSPLSIVAGRLTQPLGGAPDLVVAMLHAETDATLTGDMLLLPSSGLPALTGTRTYHLDSRPGQLAIGNVDKDAEGNQDLVVVDLPSVRAGMTGMSAEVTSPKRLTILHNPALAPESPLRTEHDTFAVTSGVGFVGSVSATASDLFITATKGGFSQVGILPNDGTGGFPSQPQLVPLDRGPGALVVSGDFNGDRILDALLLTPGTLRGVGANMTGNHAGNLTLARGL